LKDVLVPLAEEVNARALSGVPAADVAATRRCLLAAIENLSHDDVLPEGAGAAAGTGAEPAL
jgi:hypothetical protein